MEPPLQETLQTILEDLSATLNVAVPTTTVEIQCKLDEWAPPRLVACLRPRRSKHLHLPRTAKGRRRYQYARFQQAWKKDRGRAAKRVVDGDNWLGAERPLPDGTTDFWLSLYRRLSPPPMQGHILPVRDCVEGEIWKPISEGEVKAALKATKANTARGLDGRYKSDIEALGMDKLRWLLNAILFVGQPPADWVRGRTVLIPKIDEPSTPSDYRPLTITPVLTRTVNRVLARRVSTWAPLPRSQRGFREEDGCAANILLLKAALRHAKAAPSPIYMAFIDFKKAFDSVGHPVIVQACQRWGLGPSSQHTWKKCMEWLPLLWMVSKSHHRLESCRETHCLPCSLI